MADVSGMNSFAGRIGSLRAPGHRISGAPGPAPPPQDVDNPSAFQANLAAIKNTFEGEDLWDSSDNESPAAPNGTHMPTASNTAAYLQRICPTHTKIYALTYGPPGQRAALLVACYAPARRASGAWRRCREVPEKARLYRTDGGAAEDRLDCVLTPS
ncbi:hypothetical protein MVEN_01145500 [Mycena venus]|uniref:Uncharacterized protein n=1 Tax=Mycena venus TaxID=2733690 RepID=A0A8H6Y0L7_9AGAR|nr:hypothetical protein MVEN_01145500 [Mycena venus]